MDFMNNARIDIVQRRGANDRYGQPIMETIYSDFGCRLIRQTRFFRSIDGDQLMIDATVYVDPIYELDVGDAVTMDNQKKDKYDVFSVDDLEGVDGQTVKFRCLLTKQR